MTCPKCGGLLKKHVNGKQLMCVDCLMKFEIGRN